ncbi:MAG: preprotein translocase subunit YajC [Clostridia bacterium]|nr:preprotein translocase subunit YajC [Clostridia bacterium]
MLSMDPWVMIIYIVALFAIMYFLMIRPQRKKQKEEERMRNNLQVGDEILTIGGIYGKIVAMKEDSFILESGPDRAKIRVAKWALQQNFTVHEDDTQAVKGKTNK